MLMLQNPDKRHPPQSDGQAGESSTPCLLPSQTQSEAPKQVSCDVTDQERKPDLADRVDQISSAKTKPPRVQVLDGQQLDSNNQTLPYENTSRPSPRVQPKRFSAPRHHFDSEMSGPFEDGYPKGGGKGPRPHFVYSDLVARVNRMEELQHSQLMRIAKVCVCVCVRRCVCVVHVHVHVHVSNVCGACEKYVHVCTCM